ncbi:chorismate--pyruvate lyase [Vibrio sp. 10N.286.49.B3]|nr:chorismate--pyruvate lyase [Vibrio sp. 10N.286.49.B3]
MNIEWESPEHFYFPSELAKQWLIEPSSLSLRLAKHCRNLSVKLQYNQIVEKKMLRADECELFPDQVCLLREVVLQGDEQHWVVARTLIPSETLNDGQYDLSQQGEVPLGLTVFRADNVERDQLQVGSIKTNHGVLLARRSRLWMNNKPMLVAELFLPHAPIYSMEKN